MIIAQVIGADKVVAHLLTASPRVMSGVQGEVSRLVLALLRKVKEEKLSGQVLKNQTGTLRRSINQKVVAGNGTITGSVGTNLSYARAHEFGCKDTVTVPEHLRMMKVAWGKAVKAPRQILVSAHPMKMNLKERSFLRSAINEMNADIRAGIAAAVRKAI